jgi:hypothetical protein
MSSKPTRAFILESRPMEARNRDGSTGQIYISHLQDHSELYLIIPFKDRPTQ